VFSYYCDVLVASANNSAQTLQELGESMTYCSPIASEYGLTLEQTAKALGSLANYGIKGSQAGTTLRRILTNLADPKIQKKLKGFGVDLVDVNTGKLRDVSEVLHDLSKATLKLPKDKKLGLFKELFGLYAIAGGAKLTIAQFDKLINAVDNAAGTGKRAAKEMDSGIGGSMRMLWSAVEGVAIAIGEALTPTLKRLADYFTIAISGTADYITKHKELIVSAGKIISIITGIGAAFFVTGLSIVGVGKSIGILATSITTIAKIALAGFSLISGAISVLTFLAGGIATVFMTVVSGLGIVLGGIATAFTSVLSGLVVIGTTVFSGIAAAITALVSPIGLVVLALTAIGGVTYLIYRNFSTIKNVVTSIFNGIISAINQALTSVKTFLNQFVEFKILFATVQLTTTILKTLGQTFLWLGRNIVLPVIYSIVDVFVWLGRQLVNICTNIVSITVSVFSRIGGFIVTIFSGIVSIVGDTLFNIVTVISGIFSTLRHVLSPFVSIIGAIFNGAVQIVGGFISILRTLTGYLISLARSFFVIETGLQIFSILSRVVSSVAGIFATVARGIFTTFFTLAQYVPTIISTLVRSFIAVPGLLLSAFKNIPRIVSSIFSTAVGIVRGVVGGIGTMLSGLVSFMTGMWNGLVNIFVSVFETLGSIVSGFGNFFVGAFQNIRTSIGWLMDMFGSLCSIVTESFSTIVSVLGRGDIETAIQVIWATLKLIWVKGSTSLLSTWYWLTETLQSSWAICVFKVSELLTTAWFGVQQFWTETVYTMSTLWLEFSNNIISAWKTAEQTIAQGIGYIIAKIQGLDPNEMANIISDDYQRQSQQRENEKHQKLATIQQQHDTRTSALESEKQGTLSNLRHDFDNNAANRKTNYDAKIAAQEAELQATKNAYNEAINRAKNPKQEGIKESASLQDRLKSKAAEAIKGFKVNTDLGSKISVSGSFSAAAIQSMGLGTSMDRVVKATEKSEKHLEKLVNKNDKPDKQPTIKKDQEDKIEDEDLTVRELKQQTRYLRDISEHSFSPKFA
jgi:phage-related protein